MRWFQPVPDRHGRRGQLGVNSLCIERVDFPMTNLPRPRSGPLTTGPARAPQRAMLRAVGLSEEDLALPQVAVASSWNEVTPCNLHLNSLAVAARRS